MKQVLAGRVAVGLKRKGRDGMTQDLEPAGFRVSRSEAYQEPGPSGAAKLGELWIPKGLGKQDEKGLHIATDAYLARGTKCSANTC